MARGQLGGFLRYLRRTFGGPAGDEGTDGQLLRRFARGRDEAAFTALVRRHGPMVLAVCRRVLGDVHAAEDAFQAAFVVLATKAAAPGWSDSVGSWLYEVAYRCASKAKVGAARRRFHEQQVPPMPPSEPTPDLDRRELRALLDAELHRLPEKYRAPLVLCYLEGKTNEAAARELGWPLGTVNGRLARGRDLLRARLARRQLALSAGLFAAALSEGAAPAALPAALLDATVRAVLLPQGEVLAAPVATLVEGVLQTMFVTNLKTTAVALLAVGLLGAGAGAYFFRAQAAATVDAKAPPAAETEKEKEPATSEPVVKDGLSIRVQPARAAFALKEPLSFTVTFRNETKEAFHLCDPLYPWGIDRGDSYFGYRFRIEDVGRGGYWLPATDADLPLPKEEDSRKLPAGQSLQVRLSLTGPQKPVILKPVSFIHRGVEGAGLDEVRGFLDTGKYRLVVSAAFGDNRADKDLKRRHWSGEIAARPVEFEVDDKIAAAPKAARVNGADFEAVAEKVWRLPAPGKTSEADVGLRISNPLENDRTFIVWETPVVNLTAADGTKLRANYARRKTRPETRLVVPAGKSHTVSRRTTLSWEADGKTLKLQGTDDAGGFWSFDKVAPGKYKLALYYACDSEEQTKGLWTGQVTTEPVEIEIPASADGVR